MSSNWESGPAGDGDPPASPALHVQAQAGGEVGTSWA